MRFVLCETLLCWDVLSLMHARLALPCSLIVTVRCLLRLSAIAVGIPAIVAPVDALIALKRAHVFWPLQWDKHIRDLHALLALRNGSGSGGDSKDKDTKEGKEGKDKDKGKDNKESENEKGGNALRLLRAQAALRLQPLVRSTLLALPHLVCLRGVVLCCLGA